MWQLAQPNEYHPIKILHLQGQTHKKKEGSNESYIYYHYYAYKDKHTKKNEGSNESYIYYHYFGSKNGVKGIREYEVATSSAQ